MYYLNTFYYIIISKRQLKDELIVFILGNFCFLLPKVYLCYSTIVLKKEKIKP